MNSNVIKWLNEKLGCNISAEYYNYIDEWLDWWRGYRQQFHNTLHNNGKNLVKRDLYNLKMGKKVCEDWASILLNSKTHIKISDEKTNDFVQGKRETEGVLGGNCFWTKGNGLVEDAFATGTGAVTLSVSRVRIKNGRLERSPDAKIVLTYLSADYIVPLTVIKDSITEAAFVSEMVIMGKKHIAIEMHRLNNLGNYEISNYLFLAENNQFEQQPLPGGMAETFDTGSPLPWFSIVMPNIKNNIKDTNGLGISVLHNAIDALKAVDLCFNNFCSDFYLGQKKVFMEKGLIEYTEDGREIAPDDVHQQLFSFIQFPKSSLSDSQKFIYEFNPALRVEDNTKGVQAALDYLSFKCGLGNKHYQFNGGTVVTATQYTGDKQDLIQNADKHYAYVEQFLLSLVRSIIYIGKNIIGADIKEDSEVEIDFDRSIIIDDTAERLQDQQEVRDGLQAKWEFRVKYHGETKEEAKAMIAEIDGEQDIDLGFDEEGG